MTTRIVLSTPRTKVKTVNLVGGVVAGRLIELGDVDAGNLANNQPLVYNAINGLFQTKAIPVIDGGSF